MHREKLGSIVFNNDKERKVLNSIVHPAVRRLLAWELVKAWFRGEKLCVVDAPLLVEAGLWKMCGAIVVVYWCARSPSSPSPPAARSSCFLPEIVLDRGVLTLARSARSSEILQLQRLRSRNNLSLADAQARLSAQAPLSSKLKYADLVIDNSGPLADLDAQVERVVARLHERAGWSWVLSWLCPPVGIVRAVLRVGWRLWVKGVGKDKSRRTRGERRPESIELKDRSSRRRGSEPS